MTSGGHSPKSDIYTHPGAPMLGPVLRPGGTALTARALDAAAFPPGARLLDIGCGGGEALRLALARGLDCVGVDHSPPLLEQARAAGLSGRVQMAEAQNLPFPDAAFDGAFLECALSAMEERPLVLAEARRVLKPGGLLLCSDLFASPELAATLDVLSGDLSLFTQADFACRLWEDHTKELITFYGQMIMTLGSARAARETLMGSGTNEAALKALEYHLLVLERL